MLLSEVEARKNVLFGTLSNDYWADYWSTATPGFGKVMSRNRFEMILSFLHFANNDNYIERGQAGYDKLFKIPPIIDLVIPQFSAVYGPCNSCHWMK